MRYSLILFLIPILLFSKELTLSGALANALKSNQDLALMEHDYQRLREAEQSSKLDFFGKGVETYKGTFFPMRFKSSLNPS